MEWLWNLHCFVNQSPLESPLCTQCTNRIFFFLKRQWFFLSKCFYMNGCYCFDYLHPYPLPTCLPTSTTCRLVLVGEEGFLNSAHALLVFLLLTVSSWGKGTDLWELELLEPLATEQWSCTPRPLEKMPSVDHQELFCLGAASPSLKTEWWDMTPANQVSQDG